MKEISRRSMYYEEEGMACGPVGIAAIDAEIVVEMNNGQKVYLSAQWVDAAGDEIYYQATKASAYEYYLKLHGCDFEESQELIEEKNKVEEDRVEDNPEFAPFYEELKQMVYKEMRDNDLEDVIDDLEENSEDEIE